MTHEIERDGEIVDVWAELGPAEAIPARPLTRTAGVLWRSVAAIRHPIQTRRLARNRRAGKVTVVLQKGHCYRRSGSTGAPGEQGFNSAVVDRAAELIRSVGHVAVVLADTSSYPRGDVFVAVHYDGSTNPAANGASVGYPDTAGGAVAARWKAAYAAAGWSRGFRADNYTAALRGYYGYGRAKRAGIPARFLVEAGFGSNPGDRAWLDSDRGRDACAQAITAATTGTTPTTEDWLTMATRDDVKAACREAVREELAATTVHGQPLFNRLANIDVRGHQTYDEVRASRAVIDRIRAKLRA